METQSHCGGRMEWYIRIYLSMPYSYVLCGFNANSLFRRIHARMDNGARGILLRTHAVYMPPAIPTYYPPSPYYLPAIVYRATTNTAINEVMANM
jgi:hypothetical protein